MLDWDEQFLKDSEGRVTGARYETWVPHWGDAVVHPCDDRPGEMFLECPGLGIHRHSLGQVAERDALDPAEMALLRALEERGIWCLEALVAIGSSED